MAYMVFERLTMEVVHAYGTRSDAATQLDAAGRYRRWVEALPIDPGIRAALVEPIAAVEEGLREAIRRRDRDVGR